MAEKNYTVKANSITGVRGRIMTKEAIVPESWLLNISEHENAGHIEVVVEVTEVVATAKTEQKIADKKVVAIDGFSDTGK